jgi:hypothetical protein
MCNTFCPSALVRQLVIEPMVCPAPRMNIRSVRILSRKGPPHLFHRRNCSMLRGLARFLASLQASFRLGELCSPGAFHTG